MAATAVKTASGATGSSTPATERGATTVPAKVVARIAEQAAFEVRGVGSAAGGVLGVGARRDFDSRPSVDAEVYGGTVVLRLDVGVTFPAHLASVLTELRRHVSARVEELTGLSVGQIDVTVSWLRPASTSARRELL